MPDVQIIIVEDDAAARDRLTQQIAAIEGFTLAGTAETIAAGRKLLATQTPDILLVDLELPDGNGTEIIQEQRQLHPNLPILVTSVLGDERSVIAAIESGAQGYLLKSDTNLAIAHCLQQLMAGGAPISAGIARHLIRRLQPPVAVQQEDQNSDSSVAPTAAARLSDRELEVLTLAAKGYSYQDIAQLLEVSVNTVGSYTRRTYQKLAVHSKSAAVFEAMKLGLMDQPGSDE